VLDWAASGAMALTGHPGAAPTTSPAPVLTVLGRVTDRLARVTGQTGTAVRADPAELLTGRAGLAGLHRGGRVSAGGASRLLRTADGWCAVTLSRPEDAGSVPAILGALGLDEPDPVGSGSFATSTAPAAARAETWLVLEAAARRLPASDLAGAAQLLGVPAAALPADSPATLATPVTPGSASAPPATETALAAPPWQVTRIAAPSPMARLAGAVVADLSAMWAGPLCAHLIGLAGADVIKVESASRPDGARSGDQRFFDWLHAGHRSLVVDLQAEHGRAELAALLGVADIVIESSRPRALANLALAPEATGHRNGQVWLSVTGYGRGQPDQVAFGDDAAVAGGLVGWDAGEPVFCADAVADPLTGVCGALAVAESVAAGGGHLIDLPMRAAAAAFAAAPPADHGPHPVRPVGTGWQVTCPHLGRSQAVLPPRRPVPTGSAAALGADTTAVLARLAGR
jgi:crotonobetainyl-CoA:carnitine CoA-transferase CaiB-like acyl-CoA transferase